MTQIQKERLIGKGMWLQVDPKTIQFDLFLIGELAQLKDEVRAKRRLTKWTLAEAAEKMLILVIHYAIHFDLESISKPI